MTAAYQALALNADFRPITAFPLSIWTFEDTLRKFLAGKIMVIETHDAVLRTPSFDYRPPSVVALKAYAPQPRAVRFNRLNLFLRDDFPCQYCGVKGTTRDLTFDHVIPRAHGGETTWLNVVAACSPCNLKKGSKLPKVAGMVPHQKPYQPTVQDLHNNGRSFPPNYLHESWMDYLYWDTELQP